MKLGICCNFTFPSIGGSEIVCQAIAERMANPYGMQVTTFGYNVNKDFIHNNVSYKKCLRGNHFLNQISDLDHVFIYSDSFWGFETILNNMDFLKPSLSIALLGMYAMYDNPLLFEVFKEHRKKFKIITHANNYQDYIKCFNNKIPVNIIPNGVDPTEFKNAESGLFKKKYDIKTNKIILNVSNFFFGKGQDHLVNIGNALKEIRGDDFTFVQLSNSVKYPHDISFFERSRKIHKTKGQFQFKFLRNLKREDVISAFTDASVFVLTSLKEVSPIVLLESMAARTPWVSMNVGNADNLWGGWVIENKNCDNKGYKIYTNSIYEEYAIRINGFLDQTVLSQEFCDLGERQIEETYNWETICEKYYNIFID